MARNYLITQEEFEEVRINSETALNASQSMLSKVDYATAKAEAAKINSEAAVINTTQAKEAAEAAAARVEEVSKTVASDRMPIVGGSFTGDAYASNDNRDTSCLRNIEVHNMASDGGIGEFVSTNKIIFVRKATEQQVI